MQYASSTGTGTYCKLLNGVILSFLTNVALCDRQYYFLLLFYEELDKGFQTNADSDPAFPMNVDPDQGTGIQ
jgi:hypothetical protein